MRFALALLGPLGLTGPVLLGTPSPSPAPPPPANSRAVADGRAAGEGVESVVVTGTRTPESSQRPTVKTDVVSAAEIRARGAANVAEALDRQAGVTVGPQASFGGAAVLQIQGFDRDRVLVLEDGERVIGDVGGAIDLARLPVADLARLEVVTGPTSALYGTSAIGGVVNLVTVAPRRNTGYLRLDSRVSRAFSKTIPGLVVQGGGAILDADSRFRPWVAVDLSATSRSATPRAAAEEGERALASGTPAVASSLVGIRGGFRLSERTELRARARWIHDESAGVELRQVPGLPAFIVDLPAATDRGTFHLIQESRVARTWTLRSTLGLQQVGGVSANDLRGSPLDTRRLRHQRLASAEVVATFAKGPWTVVTGARVEAETFAQETETSARVGEAIVVKRTPEVAPGGVVASAGYSQTRWDISKQFRILAGVRAENNSRYGGTIAPRLGLFALPGDRWTVRASLGSGFRAPSSKELGFLFDHSAYGYRVLGAPDLRPERSWGTNADVTYQKKGEHLAGSLRVGLFGNRVVDLIDLDYAAARTASDGVVEYRYRNVGRALTYGGTVDAKLSTPSKSSLSLGYSLLGTRNLDAGGVLPGRPPHTLTAVGELPVGAGLLTLRGRVVSAARLDGADGASARSPAFSLVDARYARPIAAGTTLAVGLLNLLDARQQPGRAGDQRPLLGRTFYVSLSFDMPEES